MLQSFRFWILTCKDELHRAQIPGRAFLAQSVELKSFNSKVSGSIPLCATIFLPETFATYHTSLHVKTYNQNDRSLKNRSIFLYCESCLNCQGPALKQQGRLISHVLIRKTPLMSQNYIMFGLYD